MWRVFKTLIAHILVNVMVKMVAKCIEIYLEFRSGVFSNDMVIWVSALISITSPSTSHGFIDCNGAANVFCMTPKS